MLTQLLPACQVNHPSPAEGNYESYEQGRKARPWKEGKPSAMPRSQQ